MSKFSMAAIVLGAILLGGCGTQQVALPQDVKASASEVVKQVQENPELMKMFGEAQNYLQQGDYQEAIHKADEILKMGPNAKALSTKAMALALEGDTDQALKLAKESYGLDANDATNYYNLAMIYKLRGDLSSSESWFKRVLEKDPNNTWSIYGIATIYADEGKRKEALDWLEKAIKADPQVKETAREQDHFASFHGDERFNQLVK